MLWGKVINMRIRNIAVGFFGSMVVAMLLLGCARLVACGYSWNVYFPPDAEVHNSYESGAVYELSQDVFMFASDSEIEKRIGYLVPPGLTKSFGPRMFSAPPTIESWEKKLVNLDKWNGEWDRLNGFQDISKRIVGVVRRGTRVRFLHMKGRKSVSIWYGYSRYDSPIAMVLDGDYAAWSVDLADISCWNIEKHIDKRFLRKIDSLVLDASTKYE